MYHNHIVIVGAGIVGLSTAVALLNQGVARVTILEQATVDHPRATSHGFSRLIRPEYGADRQYTEMVRHSLQQWKQWARQTQRTLYTPTGMLVMGKEHDGLTSPGYYSLREAGFAPEALNRHACKERFPQFNVEDYDVFTYNKEAGMLHASTCLQTLRQMILDMGGLIKEGCRVTQILHENRLRPIRLRLHNGQELTADRLVLATGPWVHRLLANLQLPIQMTRQYLLYFSQLPISEFGISAFPAFLADDLYGFPIYTATGPHWLKAASHSFGTDIDPDDIPIIEERVIKQVTQRLYHLIPALQQAQLVHIDACMYDVSPDEHFILDRHPADKRIVFATGLSGHGFKFGPLIGSLLSSLLCETPPAVSMERFRLARFAHVSQQAHSVA